MKLSTAMNKAARHLDAAEKLLEPFNKQLADVLDDYSVHVFRQGGDGFVIAYNGGQDNASFDPQRDDVDSLLKVSKDELLAMLEENSI